MSDRADTLTEKELLEWAGIEYEGEEIPIQLRRLIWAARTQGSRIAWRDVYQIAASQMDTCKPPPDAKS